MGLSGHCLCKAVTYTVDVDAPLLTGYDHCDDCQRQSGSTYCKRCFPLPHASSLFLPHAPPFDLFLSRRDCSQNLLHDGGQRRGSQKSCRSCVMSSYCTESATPPPHIFPPPFFPLQAKFKLSELNEPNESFGGVLGRSHWDTRCLSPTTFYGPRHCSLIRPIRSQLEKMASRHVPSVSFLTSCSLK